MSDSTTTNDSTTDNDSTTASGFASLQIVTTSCHGVLNTNFTAPTTKPDWFDDLDAKLAAAKVLANQWVDDIAPDMTASIPAHVINYGTTYAALTDQIVELLDKDPTASGADNTTIQEAFALISALHSSVDKIIKEVEAAATQMTTWGDDMQSAHDDLFNGAANIQSAETDLQADIDSMNSAIDGLRAQIDAENKAIAAGAAAIGIGVLALVAGIALAPETGGASLIVAGIGGAAIVGGAVDWGVMQSKINDQFDKIADDQKQVTLDQAQLVALQGLSLSANSAISSIAVATQALSDVKTMWSLFKDELQGTMDKLDQADEELMAIVDKAYILAAQKEWTLATEFAQKLVNTTYNVETQTVSMEGTAEAA
ncbi:hypothetical protein CI610_00571 [invertebrate metagenome]|uniref:Non-hemolytic enterotoxin lytic component L1 n=1 Tax=invertebrate metagenome TaxID=1711999 RepID=A0A2H9TB09_9ZZZZ